MDTKKDGPPSTTNGAKMLLQFGALGVTMSWDDGFPGARASRPHQAWHSLGQLPHLDQPATAPWHSFGLADGVLAHRVAACSIALKLNGDQRDRMRAGRPRSQAMPSRRCGGGCPAGDFSESRRAPFGKLPFARESGPRPPRRGGSFEEKRLIVNDDEPRMDTKKDGPPSTTNGAKMLLQFCALGVTMSWDEGFLGARASRPHKAWHSLGHLPHLDQPGTAPWLSFGLADAVPADRVAACSIALKLNGDQRDRMRAGRPRSQAIQDGADHSRVKQRIIVAYPEQGLFREKPVGDKPSCLSCPSM